MGKLSDSIMSSDPRRLADLMDLQPEVGRYWAPDELAAVLCHQLATPLQVDLGTQRANHPALAEWQTSERCSEIITFGDLLRHPNPPVTLLKMVKDFAKACLSSSRNVLPREIASVLYIASITAAMTRQRQRITKLTDPEVRASIECVLAHAWLDDATRALLTEGLRISKLEKSVNHSTSDRPRNVPPSQTAAVLPAPKLPCPPTCTGSER